MRRFCSILILVAVMIGSTLSLTGCIVAPPYYRPARVWVPGYWGGGHVWVGGYYRYR